MNRLPTATLGFQLIPRTNGPLTQTDIVRFAGAGGDFNPLHHDPEFARQAGFEKPIAMGQFSAGLLAAWLTDWCGVENLVSLEVRFTAPLPIGATLEFSGTVTALDPESQGQTIADLELTGSSAGKPVVTGIAQVRITTD